MAFYRLFYLQFCDSSDQWKKHCVAKVLLAIWEIFLHENNRNYDSYRFSYKSVFIHFFFFFFFFFFFSFLTNQKQESGFQQVGALVTRNISVFCLKLVALYFKAMPNSVECYNGDFLACYSCSYYSSMLRRIKTASRNKTKLTFGDGIKNTRVVQKTKLKFDHEIKNNRIFSYLLFYRQILTMLYSNPLVRIWEYLVVA